MVAKQGYIDLANECRKAFIKEVLYGIFEKHGTGDLEDICKINSVNIDVAADIIENPDCYSVDALIFLAVDFGGEKLVKEFFKVAE